MKWVVTAAATLGVAFYAQGVQGQQDTVKRLRTGCHLNRRLQIERDTDMAGTDADAAHKLRSQGDVITALRYERYATRAEARVALQVHRSCEAAYPLPSLLP